VCLIFIDTFRPAVGDLVEINGRLGLPLEKINGKTMQEIIIQKPWRMFQYWRMLVELQIKLSETEPIQELPPHRKFIKDKIQNNVQLESAMKSALLDSLDKLPDGNRSMRSRRRCLPGVKSKFEDLSSKQRKSKSG